MAGTTAYFCSPTGSKGFGDAHCTSEGSGYSHEAIGLNKLRTYGGTNGQTENLTSTAAPTVLSSVIAGVETEIKCTEAELLGQYENFELGAEMRVRGAVVITYTGCSVQKPAGKGCKVASEKIVVGESPLGWVGKMELTTQGTGMGLKFVEGEGGPLSKVKIEGCSISALNNTFPLTGSFIATPTGATITTTETEVTAQETLVFAGNSAGLATKITLRGLPLTPPLVFTT